MHMQQERQQEEVRRKVRSVLEQHQAAQSLLKIQRASAAVVLQRESHIMKEELKRDLERNATIAACSVTNIVTEVRAGRAISNEKHRHRHFGLKFSSKGAQLLRATRADTLEHIKKFSCLLVRKSVAIRRNARLESQKQILTARDEAFDAKRRAVVEHKFVLRNLVRWRATVDKNIVLIAKEQRKHDQATKDILEALPVNNYYIK